ncbi:hypothetical protein [Acetivibrio cellulolyticus]|uniref:hypothetical protein n=1 Tax=Acetivibrio cellulolyticus TaxID=35830 RepID=UPI0001E2C2BD|nr:hypothetical protein [Acetivibrio cellulolyticus]
MKKNKESDYEKQLNIKIEERLSSIENPDYLFAKRFGKKDYLITFIVGVFCLAALIYGAYL